MKKLIFLLLPLFLTLAYALEVGQDDGVIGVNFEEPDSQTYYPTTYKTIFGTESGNNNLGNLSYYDNQLFNITESAGPNPLTFLVNFSGVSSFDSVLLRERYTGTSGHLIFFELYDFSSDSWEEYYSISDQAGLVVEVIPVFDPDEHVSSGNVSVMFYHLGTGVSTYKLLIDFIQLQKGSTTLVNTEHDSLSGRNNILINHPNTIDVFVPYTGATSDVDLASHKIVFNDNSIMLEDDSGRTLTSGLSWIFGEPIESASISSLTWYEILGGNSIAWDGSGNLNLYGGGTFTNIDGNIESFNGNLSGIYFKGNTTEAINDKSKFWLNYTNQIPLNKSLNDTYVSYRNSQSDFITNKYINSSGSIIANNFTQITDSNKFSLNYERNYQGWYYGNDANAGLAFTGNKARGTSSSPSIPNDNDIVVSALGRIYDGNDFLSNTGARYSFKVDGTPSSTKWNMKMDIDLAQGTSLVTVAQFNSSGNVKFPFAFGTYLSSPQPLYIDTDTGDLGFDPSSARFKENIMNTTKTGKEVLDLRVVDYELKADSTNNVKTGLIAEEVLPIYSDAVIFDRYIIKNNCGVDETGENYCNPQFATNYSKPLSINYLEFIPLLIKQNQEQQKEIDELNKKVTFLEQNCL